LVDVIAAEIRRRREAANMSAQKLADRCAELGHPIGRNVISKLENGDRDGVSVAELLVLARALGVAPAMLIAPFDDVDEVEVLPGKTMTSFNAYRWLVGEMTWTNEPAERDRFGRRAPVVDAYDRHARALSGWIAADAAGDDAKARDHRRELAWVRHEMREKGWRVPQLDESTEAAIEAAEHQVQREIEGAP
jgi:transcriptional regulator with XRE-family HTH domain